MRSMINARSAAALLLGAVACGDEATRPDTELSLVRAATAVFADTAVAAAAGYTAALTGCMANGASGAMGVHVGHPGRIDAIVELERPEAVMYEPQPTGGDPVIVGVEYLVPFSAWTAATPPTLMGQTFRRNEAFQVWALHAWVHRDNPAGVFADWNPGVSCPAASPAPVEH